MCGDAGGRRWPPANRCEGLLSDDVAGSAAVQPGSGSTGYREDEVSRLEFIWGEGFMSPGGPAEVARTLAGVDLTGLDVLDIGCGIGGVDLALVREHGAARVTGVDVQSDLLDVAVERARRVGLAGRVQYQLVVPGPLPFDDDTFDVAFSKDAIIHVHDKAALYADIHRVLRPGGLLRVSDWLRGDGDEFTAQIGDLVGEAGHDFTMWSLAEAGRVVTTLGFVDVELEDRNQWYLAEARREVDELRGPSRADFVDRYGEEATVGEIDFWTLLVDNLDQGALRPGHIRGRKPLWRPESGT
jgi:SAM-dependent methyltransferase